MLRIHNRENLLAGQVFCLRLPDQPEPDLNADRNSYVRLFPSGLYYACDRNGALLNKRKISNVLIVATNTGPRSKVGPIPMIRWSKVIAIRIDPAPNVEFVPVVQLNWNDVLRKREGKYVVYNPDGALLQGPTGHPLRYRPERHVFTLRGTPVREDPQDILRDFADKSECDVGALVFVPGD